MDTCLTALTLTIMFVGVHRKQLSRTKPNQCTMPAMLLKLLRSNNNNGKRSVHVESLALPGSSVSRIHYREAMLPLSKRILG